eukprot:TRINITY_DN314_c0_g3_i1.p2 TRINITY_DN314_c0_g3~~TRINITY_DN314_c0_g3_i1.p2  ORF type:complete len:183 (+),score=57.16 TRINITY_DN314_c0_g3_i1:462-1010(+)
MQIEGHFTYFHKELSTGKPGFWTTKWEDFVVEGQDNSFLQVYKRFWHSCWVEYGHADGRYLISDSFVLSMETVTAVVDGPLCILAGYFLATGSSWLHVTQLTVSLFQIYGDILYFGTEWLDNFSHVDQSHWLYTMVYFLFLNGLWILIPGMLVIQSVNAIVSAFNDQKKLAALDTKESKKKK